MKSNPLKGWNKLFDGSVKERGRWRGEGRRRLGLDVLQTGREIGERRGGFAAFIAIRVATRCGNPLPLLASGTSTVSTQRHNCSIPGHARVAMWAPLSARHVLSEFPLAYHEWHCQ
jgi:hypothetical protein